LNDVEGCEKVLKGLWIRGASALDNLETTNSNMLDLGSAYFGHIHTKNRELKNRLKILQSQK